MRTERIPAPRSRPRRSCAAPCRRSSCRLPAASASPARAADARAAACDLSACDPAAWRASGWRAPARLLGACVTLRHAFLEFAEQQLELLDLAVELLRGAAEPRPSQYRELRFEMLDLKRLGIELRIAHREQPIAFGQLRLLLGDDLLALAEQCFLLGKHPLQRAGIAWRCGALRRHARHTM